MRPQLSALASHGSEPLHRTPAMNFSLRFRSALLAAIVFVLAFDLAWIWQRTGGAWWSEFGGHPDEAAHYVTGLMIRDYVAAGFPGSPMRYGETYYAHYPKIGLGVWPPVFYVVQAAWTLPFSPARPSVLLLMCALAASVAWLIYLALRREYGGWAAALGALLWVSLPLVREHYSMVMAEMLSAALMFGAVLAWGAYLDRERTRDALLFGLLAALAILTKGTGLALALMAPLALAMAGRWHLLKRPALWGAAALTAILAGPWTWAFKDKGKGGWLHPSPTWEFTQEALPYYAAKLGFALGIVAAILFVLGIVARLRVRREQPGRWAAAVALIVAVIAFQAVAPVGLEARHLIPALPAAVMFSVAGAVALLRRFHPAAARESGPADAPIASAVGMLILFGAAIALSEIMPLTRAERKNFSGFAPIASDVVRALKAAEGQVLVSSDARGEGMFIAEMAMRDPHRPGFVVQRGSKALVPEQKGAEKWRTGDRRQRFTSEEDLLEFLTSGKLRYLVLDDSIPEARRLPYHDALSRLVASRGDHFFPLSAMDAHRGSELVAGRVRLFRVEGSSPLTK
jgi:hypothetical protein